MRRKRGLAVLTGIVLGMLWPSHLQAQSSVVRLAGGDQVSGELVSMIDGKLAVETAWGGKLEIDFTRVEAIESDGAVRLELVSGERVDGELLPASAGELRVRTAVATEPLVLALADVAAINPPPVVRARYQGTVALGANVQSGNSERTSLSAAAEAARETDADRVSLRLRWNDAKEGGERTARSTFGALKYDYFLAGSRYLYTSAELLADEFKDLDLRTVVGVGFGFEPVSRESFTMSLEGGISYISRNFLVAEDEDEVTLRLSTALAWAIGRRLHLRERLVVYPSFEESSFELRNELSLATELFGAWAMELSNVLEYDSEPSPGVEEDDLLWVLGLQYAF